MFADKEHKPESKTSSHSWQNPFVQKKSENGSLEIGAKDDPQEKEADDVAEHVVSGSTLNVQGSDDGNFRRREEDEEKKENTAAPKLRMKEEIYRKVQPMKDESAAWRKYDKEHGHLKKLNELTEEPVRKMGEDDPQTLKMGDDHEGPVRKMGEDEPQTMKMGDDHEGPVRKMGQDPGGAETASPAFQQQLNASKGQGQALPDAVQKDIGPKMGADLSDVKIHTDSHAHAMATDINAKAFTHGSDIYFKKENYNPTTEQGKKLLVHESWHTVQQSQKVLSKLQRQPDDVFSIYQRISKRFKIIIDKFGLEESFTNLFSNEEMASAERLLTEIEPKLLEEKGYPTNFMFQGLRYDAWDGKNRLVIIEAPPAPSGEKHMHSFDMKGNGLVFKRFRTEIADKGFDEKVSEKKKPGQGAAAKAGNIFSKASKITSDEPNYNIPDKSEINQANPSLKLNSNNLVIYVPPIIDSETLSNYGIDANLLRFTYQERSKFKEDSPVGGCRYLVKYNDIFMGYFDMQSADGARRDGNELIQFNNALTGKDQKFLNLLNSGKLWKFALYAEEDNKGDPDFMSLLISTAFPNSRRDGISLESAASGALLDVSLSVPGMATGLVKYLRQMKKDSASGIQTTTKQTRGSLKFNTRISDQKQQRHLKGTAPPGKSYMNSLQDAQAVLDAYNSGDYKFISEDINQNRVEIEVTKITGRWVSIGDPNGKPDINYPSNCFRIESLTSPKVYPVNPFKQ